MNNTLRKREFASYLKNYIEDESGVRIEVEDVLDALEAFESVFECEVLISGEEFTTENNTL